MGITIDIFKELLALGANVVTMGNHTWGKKDIFGFLEHKQLLIPANYSEGILGNRYGIYKCNDKKIGVVNLIGRVDMNVLSDNPYTAIDKILETIKNEVDYIVIDFHAEATAEKIALGYYLDGKVNVIFGTHTHVQTADEIILENGTGYITDIGMTGPKYSVIGMEVDVSIKRFATSLPERYKAAKGEGKFNGCIFEINDQTGRVEKITRVAK